MLYATTRGKHDVVTAYKTVHVDCYGDGGLFVPFRMPKIKEEELAVLAASSQNRIIADVLNLFFSSELTEWDIEYAVGRRPSRIATVSSRLMVLECWNNPTGDVGQIVQGISHRLRGERDGGMPTNWLNMAVRIALLFAAYGSLVSSGKIRRNVPLDVAVTTGDFAAPMAAWYAKQMGLPIGKIICGCNANGSFWDLLNRGEFPTGDTVVKTATPEADFVVPRNLERLICAVFGVEENLRYLLKCSKGRPYFPPEDKMNDLCSGMFAAVCSDSRMASIVSGVYRTRGYILSPYAALAYGSLQDYRAITGENGPVLLVSERSPLCDGALVSRLVRIPEAELRQHLNN